MPLAEQHASRTVLAEPDLVKRLGDLSLEPARLTPQQFGAFLQREHDKFAAVVKTARWAMPR